MLRSLDELHRIATARKSENRRKSFDLGNGRRFKAPEEEKHSPKQFSKFKVLSLVRTNS